MEFVQFQVISTSILCLIWAAGIVLAVIRWKQSPRTAMLILISLLLMSCGGLFEITRSVLATPDADLQLTISKALGRSYILLFRFLVYGQSAVHILAWILVLAAFFTFTRKQKQSES